MKKLHRVICMLVAAAVIMCMVPSVLAAEETDPTPQPEPVKLPTPENLAWGMMYGYIGGELRKYVEEKSSTGFTAEYLPSGCAVQINYYQVGNPDSVILEEYAPQYFGDNGCQSPFDFWSCHFTYQDTVPEWESDYYYELTSGEYYFTVQLLGDGVNYLDSEIAVSEHWTYERPEAQLPAPTELNWNGNEIDFKVLEDDSNLDEYDIAFFFSQTGDTENVEGPMYTMSGYYPNSYYQNLGYPVYGLETVKYMYNDFINHMFSYYGEGYYYFRVRSISKNIEVIRTSPWSELSPAYNVASLSEEARKQLSALTDTESDLKESVQSLGTDFLETALAADQGQPGGVADLLSQLEERTGIEVSVETGDDLNGFNSEDVSIVGAALNDVPENTENIVLKVDKPQEEHTTPKEYDNTLAISFSMGLDGVVDQENLQVPVKITMPIPEDIDPYRLVILHYEQDGDVRVLFPYVFQSGDKWYASFVLRSFSDFTMAQKLVTLTLDANGGTVSGDSSVILPLSGKLDELPAAPTRSGYDFLGWYTEADGGVQVTLDTVFTEDTTIYAHWAEIKPEIKTYTVTVTASPAEYGSVDGGGTYDEGSEVTVTAAPAEGYKFVNWTENGQIVSSSAEYSFTITSDRALTAVFEKIQSAVEPDVPPTPSAPSVPVETSCQITLAEAENGKISVSANSAKAGEKITVTALPDTGYHAGTIEVTDADGNIIDVTADGKNVFSFIMPSGAVTVNAEFVKCLSSTMSDLKPNAWYHEYTDFVIEKGIMSGVGGSMFVPKGTTTRAQMVMTLWNLEGNPSIDSPMPFTDVSENSWYADAVRWAASKDIVDGYGNGEFRPNEPITREQMVTILYRYEKQKGGGYTGELTYQIPFADADKISSWAHEAVAWCAQNGIITGKGGNSFAPEDTAQRAEVAAILTRYLKLADR